MLIDKLSDGRLNDREKLYVEYIQDSVKETEGMLSALLKYSRLNTQPQEFAEIDLEKLIQGTVSTFRNEINYLGATINIECKGGDIKIVADENQIKMLISELLDNALKFHSSERKPEINISVAKDNNNILISVKDNGIGGIPDNLREEVFAFFRKLNPKEQYKGVGMGLTLCKKIAELNHGRVWLESSDNNGSTFLLSILAQNP